MFVTAALFSFMALHVMIPIRIIVSPIRDDSNMTKLKKSRMIRSTISMVVAVVVLTLVVLTVVVLHRTYTNLKYISYTQNW